MGLHSSHGWNCVGLCEFGRDVFDVRLSAVRCAAIADFSGRAPTAGGQYHWVSEFAPPSCQKFLSYLVGTALSASLSTFNLTVSDRMALRDRMAGWLGFDSLPSRNHYPRSYCLERPQLHL